MKNLLRFVLAIGFAVASVQATAAPPQAINYQGSLTNPGGTPINAPVSMTFRLYNGAQGGAALYTEVQPSVIVSNGLFNAVIGAVTPIALPFDVPYWLSVAINADQEMAPRQPLASSPYAFRAATANSVTSVTGSQISGSITTATIPVANVIGAVAGPPGPVGATGPQGATGATGVAGTAGATGAQGLQGVAGATGAQGPIGVTGSAGQAGLDGKTVLSGIGAPGAALGVNGDFYINTAANNLHGPKAAGAWPAGVALVGPQGPIGTTGATGAAGTTGATGAQGLQGVAGATGAQGPIGPTGAQGPIGATGPAGPNNITGNLTMVNSTNSTGNIMKGLNRFIHNFGANNTSVGVNSGNFLTTGSSNTAIGDSALQNNTAGSSNTAVGESALKNSANGSNSIAIGTFAGGNVTSGAGNIHVGNFGLAADSGVMRLGSGGVQTKTFIAGIRNVTPTNNDALPVVIDSQGQLGTGVGGASSLPTLYTGTISIGQPVNTPTPNDRSTWQVMGVVTPPAGNYFVVARVNGQTESNAAIPGVPGNSSFIACELLLEPTVPRPRIDFIEFTAPPGLGGSIQKLAMASYVTVPPGGSISLRCRTSGTLPIPASTLIGNGSHINAIPVGGQVNG